MVDATRDHILKTTIALLDAEPNPKQLTTRAIASAAGVGIGLINYHFGSKDKLVNEALWAVIGTEAQGWLALDADGDPEARLRGLLQTTAAMAMARRDLLRHAMLGEIQQSSFTVQHMVLPLLRDTLPNEDELRLRLRTYALVAALQAAFVQLDALGDYLGHDLRDPSNLTEMIDHLIDIAIAK
jgi:TetR/AcrR family transcriptional regulator, regulator of cefoperazone and chloramphenicol sensitivity